MGTDEGRQTVGGISRRSVLRGGLLAGAGLATIGTASAVLTGTARASVSDPQPEWSYCVYCHNMYHGLITGVCLGGPDGYHEYGAGYFNYSIYNSGGFGNTSNPQGNWNWCSLCDCLFHGQANSYCVGNEGYTGEYGVHATGAVNYELNWGLAGSSDLQPGWRWCSACHVLFFPHNSGTNGGLCLNTVSGEHDGAGSFNYDVFWFSTE